MTRRSRFSAPGALGVALIGLVGAMAVVHDEEPRSGERARIDGLDQLIAVEQEVTAELRERLDILRGVRSGLLEAGVDLVDEPDLDEARRAAGVAEVRGPGVVVVLDDSDLEVSPTGNVNDLVIHSADVQGVVNAVWRAGARAVAINDERVVATSAVLCVGNTLLLNGTVHAPPYRIEAVGADVDIVRNEPDVARFRAVADVFGLGLRIREVDDVVVEAYTGRITPLHAVPSVPVEAPTV